jgi:hypothetical protein
MWANNDILLKSIESITTDSQVRGFGRAEMWDPVANYGEDLHPIFKLVYVHSDLRPNRWVADWIVLPTVRPCVNTRRVRDRSCLKGSSTGKMYAYCRLEDRRPLNGILEQLFVICFLRSSDLVFQSELGVLAPPIEEGPSHSGHSISQLGRNSSSRSNGRYSGSSVIAIGSSLITPNDS